MPLYKTNFPNLLLKNHLLRVITVIFLLFSQSYAQQSLPKLSLENIDTLAFKKYLNKEFRWLHSNIDRKKFDPVRISLYDSRCFGARNTKSPIKEYNMLRLVYKLDTVLVILSLELDVFVKVHPKESSWGFKNNIKFSNTLIYRKIESLKIRSIFIHKTDHQAFFLNLK